MHIALGCDHRGLNLKQTIMSLINETEHSYEDFGGYDTTPVDYPDIAQKVAEAVARRKFGCGILVCSSGIGMSIAANKVKGIRAALCHNPFTASRARQHNDANVLCLGADVVGQDSVKEIVQTFLDTEFEGGRHTQRLEKIKALEAD
ncbi:MAG: ribose 5-phosphate isomerase B [Dehalococcoidia bacterium]|nr:MAG: ribose 5-phosphate isomerase B [Dehalococcoidia bacterium]